MEILTGLRVLCETGGLLCKTDDIIRIVNMGADRSFIFN